MSDSGKRLKCRTACAVIWSALVLSLIGCAAPSMPLERPALPESMTAPELPDAQNFSQRVSIFLESVESAISTVQEGTMPSQM